MDQPRRITVCHRNDLNTYLGDWKTTLDMLYPIITKRNPDQGRKYKLTAIPVPINSYANNSTDISLLLKLLNDELQILETTRLSPQSFPYESYSKSRLFIKVFFVLLRIKMDDIAGIIEYFYGVNNKLHLPSSFDDLMKKATVLKLPEDLTALLKPQKSWFNELKAKRDGIVHKYDDILISFQPGSDGKNLLGHFNTKYKRHYIYEDTRKYIGLTLSNYQRFIDDLLDFFDVKFEEWYSMGQSERSRHLTIIADGIELWWAHKYGDYRNANMQISEK